MKWEETGGGNIVLEADGFRISYNDFTSNSEFWIPSFASDEGQPETAICVDGKYYILNGDFRKEYESLVPQGLDACMKFFEANIDKESSWSN